MSVALLASRSLLPLAGLTGLLSAPLARAADSVDGSVAGVARVEDPIDEEIDEVSLMLAAAALNASIAGCSFVCCSKLGVALSRILANMLLVLLEPGGTEGLFVMVAAS